MGTDWDKWFGTKHPPALQKVTVLECVWSDCPVDVQDEASRMWGEFELGNDHCYMKWDHEEMGPDYPIIAKYLESKGVEKEKILIHFWW